MMHNHDENKENKENKESKEPRMHAEDFAPPPPSSLPTSESIAVAGQIAKAESDEEIRQLQLDRLSAKKGLIEPFLQRLHAVDNETFDRMHGLIIALREYGVLTPETQHTIAEENNPEKAIARMALYYCLAHSGLSKNIQEVNRLPLNYVMKSIEAIMAKKMEKLKEFSTEVDNARLLKITKDELNSILLTSKTKEKIAESEAKQLPPEITNIIVDFALGLADEEANTKIKKLAEKELKGDKLDKLKVDELDRHLNEKFDVAPPSVSKQRDSRLASSSSFLRASRKDKETKQINEPKPRSKL